jgi:hypothetical protein
VRAHRCLAIAAWQSLPVHLANRVARSFTMAPIRRHRRVSVPRTPWPLGPPLALRRGLRAGPDRRPGRNGTLRRFSRGGHILPKLSNSPFRTPPRNACHSPGVNRRTGPLESLLSRTPISPSGRFATSTQSLLARLRELLIQDESEPGPPERPSCVSLPTSYLAECRVIYGLGVTTESITMTTERARKASGQPAPMDALSDVFAGRRDVGPPPSLPQRVPAETS